MTETYPLSAEGISLGITRECGMLANLTIARDGRTIKPLHRAPWIDDGSEVGEGAPHLALLQGDFFCAPFGDAGPDTPAHGWPANGLWTEIAQRQEPDGRLEAHFALDHRVLGASVEKIVAVRPGHPIVYQTHVLAGGEGALPIAHHAMLHAPGGLALSFSRKVFGATPARQLDAGNPQTRSILAYPQRFENLSQVALADSRRVDIGSYPFADGHEDFVMLFDPPGATIAWSAAVAAKDGFVFFALKDPRVLGGTGLWMSNGGRSYAPWSDRHRRVLGIEEGCTHFGDGLAASTAENALSRAGFPTAVRLRPEGAIVVRYALGAIPLPQGFTRIADIRVQPHALSLVDVGGAEASVPFDAQFLEER